MLAIQNMRGIRLKGEQLFIELMLSKFILLNSQELNYSCRSFFIITIFNCEEITGIVNYCVVDHDGVPTAVPLCNGE